MNKKFGVYKSIRRFIEIPVLRTSVIFKATALDGSAMEGVERLITKALSSTILSNWSRLKPGPYAMSKVRRRKDKATVYNIVENLKEMKIDKHGQK